MLIKLPVTGIEKDIPADAMQKILAGISAGKFPKCPVGGKEGEWIEGWRKIAEDLKPKEAPARPTRPAPIVEKMKETCAACGKLWGSAEALIKLPGTPTHPMSSYTECRCLRMRNFLEKVACIAPEMETALLPPKGYNSPLAPYDGLSIVVEAEPEWFFRDFRSVLAKRNLRTWTTRIVTDAFLHEAAKPKPFSRGSGMDADGEAVEGSGTDEDVSDAALAPDLLVIRVGYELAYAKVDEVHQALLLRASRSLPTWIWVDGVSPWKPGRGLANYLQGKPTVRGAL